MGTSNRVFPRVDDIQIIEGAGPWDTKSGGHLQVLFGLPIDKVLKEYLSYNNEFDNLTYDIRGLRAYLVNNLPKGIIGANEWHRIRNELVFAIEGSLEWSCEDLYGNKKSFVLEDGKGAWTPPFILHTYEAREENSALLVIANTLFIPDEPKTHDTYSREEFQKLQAQYLQQ